MKTELHKMPGPFLFLAGPGTGKTTNLARRIRYLVKDRKIDPNNITVITFTGEAAKNMREHISNEEDKDTFVPHEDQPNQIKTMHGLGNSIISSNYELLGMSQEPVLLPPNLDKILLRDSAQLLSYSRKDAGETIECRRKGKCNPKSDKKCKICKKYAELLKKLHCIDYDDQMMLALEILKTNSKINKQIKERTQHLLIDEYQDINNMQFEFIKQLTAGQENGLFAVGDDDQSIYSWRGGSPDYVLNFHNHFKNAKIEEITECHRCGENILKSALGVVKENNPFRRAKNIHSITSHRGKTTIYDVPSDIKEAEIIVRELKKAINAKHDILILVPRHRFADVLKKELKKKRISYTCKMDIEKKGFAILDSLLMWLNYIDNNLLFRLCVERIVIKQFRGKTELVFSKISKLWEDAFINKRSLFEMIKKSDDKDMKKLYSLIDKIIKSYELNPSQFIGTTTEILSLWKDKEELQKEITYWVEEGRARNVTSSSVVRILAMQGAKGLQANAVFIIGTTEGVIPEKEMSEEQKRESRRLLYVSMTRAKRQLYLFHARKRSPRVTYQEDFEKGLKMSSFIKLMPKKYYDYIYIK